MFPNAGEARAFVSWVDELNMLPELSSVVNYVGFGVGGAKMSKIEGGFPDKVRGLCLT
jgi:hypothetical protein